MKLRALMLWMALGIAGGSVVLASNPPAVWIDVPYVEQSKEGCGSAVISMLMQYWAKQTRQAVSGKADAAKIQELLYSPELNGVPASAMEDYFRKQNYETYVFRGNWSDLESQLVKGRPLIVCLKASGGRGPLHYVVVVGIDTTRGYLFLNDPAIGKMLRISREGFESQWMLANNWALLVIPAGRK